MHIYVKQMNIKPNVVCKCHIKRSRLVTEFEEQTYHLPCTAELSSQLASFERRATPHAPQKQTESPVSRNTRDITYLTL